MSTVIVSVYHLVPGADPGWVGSFLAESGAVPVVGDYVWHPDSRNEDGTKKDWQVVARLHRPESTGTYPQARVHEALDLLVKPAGGNPFTDAAPAGAPDSADARRR